MSILLFVNQLNSSFPANPLTPLFHNKTLQDFTIIFLSILLEAIPFLIIGALISSLLQLFVTEETIAKFIPRNRFLGTLYAALIGLIFPVCDCAVIPIVRRLIKKGVPLHISITFMLAVPIVNPVTLASTYYAFSNNINMVLIRGCLGLISAMIIGTLISKMENKNNVLKISNIINTHSTNNKKYCNCGCGDSHYHSRKKSNPLTLIIDVLEHTTIELHNVGRFLIMGAFLSASMQTIISRKYILLVGQHPMYSILTMMGLAFLLAICSQTDAFIARSFIGQFTTGSIFAFLIFGPMIDIKNTLMLNSYFKGRFIIKLIFLIFLVCLLIGIVTNLIVYKGDSIWTSLTKVNLSGF